jgi:hypothetical protein
VREPRTSTRPAPLRLSCDSAIFSPQGGRTEIFNQSRPAATRVLLLAPISRGASQFCSGDRRPLLGGPRPMWRGPEAGVGKELNILRRMKERYDNPSPEEVTAAFSGGIPGRRAGRAIRPSPRPALGRLARRERPPSRATNLSAPFVTRGTRRNTDHQRASRR